MTITQCSECGGKVSTTAPACPHCGAPATEQPTQVEEKEILVTPSTEPESVNEAHGNKGTSAQFLFKALVVGAILVALYFVLSPYQNCLRDVGAEAYCAQNTSW